MKILGIETSCDETAAAVVECDGQGRSAIRSNVVFSQIDSHRAFGGVVPEIAARAHVEKLDSIITAALGDAAVELRECDGIAVTSGPGLIGGLLAGIVMAKAIAAATDKPLYAINHLEGHALSPRLVARIAFPYLLLLVSGGHTQIVLVQGVGNYKRWGTTLDDALGEAFDKTAKILGLDYPGGPSVEKAAKSGRSGQFDLPRPMRGEPGSDFSFSGLKTAVRNTAEKAAPMDDQGVADLCRAFEEAVCDTLLDRVSNSLKRFRREFPQAEGAFVAAGGVASNVRLRKALEMLAENKGFRFVAPPSHLCSDNAAMIAHAAIERSRAGLKSSDAAAVVARSRWPLDEKNAGAVGSGKRGAKA